MNTATQLRPAEIRGSAANRTVRAATSSTSALWMVNPHEVAELRAALARGQVPVDLRAKLARLHEAGFIHHYIEQHSRLLLALLLAADEGAFRGATPAERERLLRVLAYVRKDDDLIPDCHTGGFVDDHQELRSVLHELGPVIEAFKLWRLRHQVPALWSVATRHTDENAGGGAAEPEPMRS